MLSAYLVRQWATEVCGDDCIQNTLEGSEHLPSKLSHLALYCLVFPRYYITPGMKLEEAVAERILARDALKDTKTNNLAAARNLTN